MNRIRKTLGLMMAFVYCASGGEQTGDAQDRGYDLLRERMVAEQIEARGVTDVSVLEAMRKTPRHLFVPEALQYRAYEDNPLPIGKDQTISQPYIVGLMTALLEPKKSDRILEIGTGSGYQAAVLSSLVDSVFTIEIIESLGAQARRRLAALGYGNVWVRIGDGYRGWPEHVPFDAIIVTAAPSRIPEPLIDQLKLGGRMVIPVGEANQELQVIVKTVDGLRTRSVIPVRFVPMTGEIKK